MKLNKVIQITIGDVRHWAGWILDTVAISFILSWTNLLPISIKSIGVILSTLIVFDILNHKIGTK